MSGGSSSNFRRRGNNEFGEARDEFSVALQEIVIAQPFRPFPANLFEIHISERAFKIHDPIEDEQNAGAPGVLEFVAHQLAVDARADAQLFAELADERGWGVFGGLDFASGKLPLERMMSHVPALRDQDPAFTLD